MEISNYIETDKLFSLLDDIIISPFLLEEEDRILLKRFVDKISDSENFALHINETFYKYKKANKSKINELISSREVINLGADFTLKPRDDNKVNWILYHGDEILIDDLDSKLAKKIAIDINVAFNIMNSRSNNVQKQKSNINSDEIF